MISRAKAKFIKSLQLKKFRKKEGAFIVEGAKSTLELLNADFRILMLLGTRDFIEKNQNLFVSGKFEVIEVTEKELVSMGSFQSNNECLAVAENKINTLHPFADELVLVLDDIRDPGNLGTIIRIADWYGILQIIASESSAELYNPKVLQASMGSFVRVNVYYTDLIAFFEDNKSLKVYGTFTEGNNIHQVDFSKKGALLIGNESKGINRILEPFIHEKITIPRYGEAESLNAAIATAIICDRVRNS